MVHRGPNTGARANTLGLTRHSSCGRDRGKAPARRETGSNSRVWRNTHTHAGAGSRRLAWRCLARPSAGHRSYRRGTAEIPTGVSVRVRSYKKRSRPHTQTHNKNNTTHDTTVRSYKKINRSHTHTHTDREQHPRHRHTRTHTTRTTPQTPKRTPPTNA